MKNILNVPAATYHAADKGGAIRLTSYDLLPRRHAANVAPPYFLELASDCINQYLAGHVDKVVHVVLDSTSVECSRNYSMFRVAARAEFKSSHLEHWFIQMPFAYDDGPLGRSTKKGYIELSVRMDENDGWVNAARYEPPENVAAEEAQVMTRSSDPLD